MRTRREFLEVSAAAVAGMAAARVDAQSPELPARTIADAARLISAKRLSPVELTQAVLRRVDALNPRVGAFITVAAAPAMDAARAADREIQQGRYLGPLRAFRSA